MLAGTKPGPVDKAEEAKPLETKLITADSLARRTDAPEPMKRAISPALSGISTLLLSNVCPLLHRPSPEPDDGKEKELRLS